MKQVIILSVIFFSFIFNTVFASDNNLCLKLKDKSNPVLKFSNLENKNIVSVSLGSSFFHRSLSLLSEKQVAESTVRQKKQHGATIINNNFKISNTKNNQEENSFKGFDGSLKGDLFFLGEKDEKGNKLDPTFTSIFTYQFGKHFGLKNLNEFTRNYGIGLVGIGWQGTFDSLRNNSSFNVNLYGLVGFMSGNSSPYATGLNIDFDIIDHIKGSLLYVAANKRSPHIKAELMANVAIVPVEVGVYYDEFHGIAPKAQWNIERFNLSVGSMITIKNGALGGALEIGYNLSNIFGKK